MAVPLWAPFAFLACVCVVRLDWLRRVDWLVVATLVYCVAAWAFVAFLVWWLVW